MRKDLLNVEELEAVFEAQVVINKFNDESNFDGPPRRLNMQTPHDFAESFRLEAK